MRRPSNLLALTLASLVVAVAAKPSDAQTAGACGDASTTLQVSACDAAGNVLMTAGTLVSWQGTGAPLSIHVQTSGRPCSKVTLPDGSTAPCDGNAFTIAWQTDPAATLQTLAILVHPADGSPATVTRLYALDIGRLPAVSLSPGSLDSGGNISGAGAAFTLPGGLGSISLSGVSISPFQLTGTMSATPAGGGLGISSAFSMSTAGGKVQSIVVPATLTFHSPFDSSNAPTTIGLSKVTFAPDGFSIDPSLANASLTSGALQVALGALAVTQGAQSTQFVLTGSATIPQYVQGGKVQFQLPVTVGSAGVSIDCTSMSWQPASSGAALISITRISAACAGSQFGITLGANLDLPNADPIALPDISIVGGIVSLAGGTVNELPITLKQKTVRVFGVDLTPSSFSLALVPSGSGAPGDAPPGIYLKAGGSATMPAWLDGATVSIPELTVDLNSGTLAAGSTFAAIDIKPPGITVLGTTFTSSNDAVCPNPTGINLKNPKQPEFDLCGTIVLPNFMAGRAPVFAAASPSSIPQLQERQIAPQYALKAAFVSCANHAKGPCGVRYASIATDVAQPGASPFVAGPSATTPQGSRQCAGTWKPTQWIDLAIVLLSVHQASLTDASGAPIASDVKATALSPEPTGLRIDGAIATEAGLQSDQYLCMTAGFNGQGFYAATTSGTIAVHFGSGEADLSNIQVSVGNYKRSLHGAIVVVPNEATLPKLYIQDVGIDLTRKTLTDSWHVSTGFKPDYLKTGFSLVEFAASLFIGKAIIK